MKQFENIIYDVADGRARITLNRPEKLNALTLQLQAELSEALWEAAEAQGEGAATWSRYAIETFSCVALREACKTSLETGAAIVYV